MSEELSLSKAEILAFAAKLYRSPSEFCRNILPDWFPTKMPWVHRGILAMRTGRTDFLLDFGEEQWRDETASWTEADLEKILTNFIEEGSGEPIFALTVKPDGSMAVALRKAEFMGVIMPRGFSKTTVMNAGNLMDALFQDEDFFLYVSEAAAHAERQLGTIKTEMEGTAEDPNNPMLRFVFGDHQPPRQDSLKWTDKYIETLKGVMVGAVGRGGQIRGFGKRAKRPGIIVFDDIEDSESVAVDEQRKKDSHWFFSTALPARKKGGRIFIIGTLLHTDAILNKCIKSKRFSCVRFAAVDRQGDALWPYMMDLDAIEKLKQDMAEEGELSGFYLEYMSEYRSEDVQMFPASKRITISKGMENFVGLAEVMDPAISDSPSADFCSFAVVGIEKGGVKHVIDYYGEKGMDPASQVAKFFELHYRWMMKVPPEFRRHGVEAIAYQRALVHLISSEQFKYSNGLADPDIPPLGMDAYFEVTPIVHGKTGKMARVQGILKPLWHAGYLTFQTVWSDLDIQFSEWPNGKKDGPDAIAMAITLLDPFASLNLGQDFDPVADTSVPLQQLLGGKNFRRAP